VHADGGHYRGTGLTSIYVNTAGCIMTRNAWLALRNVFFVYHETTWKQLNKWMHVSRAALLPLIVHDAGAYQCRRNELLRAVSQQSAGHMAFERSLV